MKRQKLKKRKVNRGASSGAAARTVPERPAPPASQPQAKKLQRPPQRQSVPRQAEAARPSREQPHPSRDPARRAQARRLAQELPQAGEKAAKRRREQAMAENSRRHRRRRRRNRGVFYTLALLLVLLTGITLSLTVFFNIKTIVVTGETTYTAEELSSIAGVKQGDNLFRLNLDRIEETVLSQAVDLDRVVVKRALPETLRFEVTQATPEMALITTDGQYAVISSGGRFLELLPSAETIPDLLLVSGIDLSGYRVGDFLTEDKSYELVHSLQNSLEEAGITGVKGISMSQGVEISVNLDNRISLKIGTTIGLEDRLLLAAQLLKEEIGEAEYGVLDITTEGTAYFRPMTQEALQEEIAPGSQPAEE